MSRAKFITIQGDEATAYEALREWARRETAAREIADRVGGKARPAIDLDMAVTDWRQMAAAYGVSFIREARLLIESADEPGDCDGA